MQERHFAQYLQDFYIFFLACKVDITIEMSYTKCNVNMTIERDNMKNRIKQLREEKGLTQEQLGEMVGTSRQAINAIETEKFEPSIWLAYDIASVFERPIEEVSLFEESERKSRADKSRRDKNGCQEAAV